MNFKRFINKNKFVVFIVLAAVILFIAYKKTNEGFHLTFVDVAGRAINVGPKCNFDYCTGDYEVVKGQCLKKCNIISPNAIVASSDPLICKKMNDSKVISTFSRNFNSHKKLNAQGNNKEQCDCPSPYTYTNGRCLKDAIITNTWTDKIKDMNGERFGRATDTSGNKLNYLVIGHCPKVDIPQKRNDRGNITTIGYPYPYKVDNKIICDTRFTYAPYGFYFNSSY